MHAPPIHSDAAARMRRLQVGQRHWAALPSWTASDRPTAGGVGYKMFAVKRPLAAWGSMDKWQNKTFTSSFCRP
jgi:hypothetical protein